MPDENLWYWPIRTVCAVGKGGKKNTEKHPCFTVALLTRCSNHNTCQWYLLLTTVVTLPNHWLISQLPSCSYWHRLFLLVYLHKTVSSSPLARARLPPHKCKRQTPTKTVKWNSHRHTHTCTHTPSAAQSLLSRLAVLLAGQNFGSRSRCLHFLHFLSSGLWRIKVHWQHYKM